MQVLANFGDKQVRTAPSAPMSQQVGVNRNNGVHSAKTQKDEGPQRELCGSLLELTVKSVDRCHLIKNAISASWLLTLS